MNRPIQNKQTVQENMAEPKGERPVLYVEDEESDVYLTKLCFAESGLEQPLVVMRDGDQAIQYLSGQGPYADRKQYPLPCLVLLDLNLPRVSGLEVLSWIRGQPSLKDLPVVLYTSSSLPRDREQALELGASDCVIKPPDYFQFLEFTKKLKERWLVSNRITGS